MHAALILYGYDYGEKLYKLTVRTNNFEIPLLNVAWVYWYRWKVGPGAAS